MVASGIDPLESVRNSLESNFRKVTKKFEHCFNGASKCRESNVCSNGVHSEVNSWNKRKNKGCLKVLVGIFEEKNGIIDGSNTDFSGNRLELNLESSNKGLKQRHGKGDGGKGDRNSSNSDMPLLLSIDGFVKALPRLFKTEKKSVREMGNADDYGGKVSNMKSMKVVGNEKKKLKPGEGRDTPFEFLISFVVNQLNHLPKFEGNDQKSTEQKAAGAAVNPFDQFQTLFSILEEKRADVNVFLGNLNFARVGGLPSSIVGVPLMNDSVDEEINSVVNSGKSGAISPQKLANRLLSIPMSNVERLRSTLSTVSLIELIQLLPQIGQPLKEDHPDKKKLFSVQDFFRYTEAEGKRFFQELDRDDDGKVTLEDLEVAMRKRKLPTKYARDFMRHARSHLLSKSFGWKQFLFLMEQKEPTILRAYTSLCLSKSGMLQKSEILTSLQEAGLPANDDNAVAMMRFLNADSEESISYGHFRNFMLLLPSDRLQEDPRSIWFEAATVVAVPPPVEVPSGSVLKSALAGGLSCAFSAALMHPVDTVKTQVQASTLSFPEILAKLPEIGARGLYRGSIPAILGQFASHGLRMGIFETSKKLLMNVAPTVPELQVQSIASFCSTFLGTAMRIPCEVLKQRLQAGMFDTVGEAIVGTWRQDGPGAFFRGTGVTIFREVPFYVAGMGFYEESKKVVRHLLRRELEPWETIAVGAVTGGLTAVLTTPFDVIKTRMMTTPGRNVSLWLIAISVVRQEGPLGLFKGAVPRFFWVAPLGSINFAGYELLRKAMDRNIETTTTAADPLVQK
ncbi:calcium-dependent mitochondrial ATP-magnesium/phosphate carrier protein 1-like [Andrographis paniculata]|uniref:calcium-dependent mitochondrial ATP-magnesium/phosphate carrier protein 1-like n=1 Tax=Andrographis paniculata TaxID=175694 RepID=UPI0021E6EA6D|nr:calcium-dependent mitochondrial ATP-magnesium/phosphate carrier protein 1-like [Andrographis paniculata]